MGNQRAVRKSGEYCLCGIALQGVDIDGHIRLYCPRCQDVKDEVISLPARGQLQFTEQQLAAPTGGFRCEVCQTPMTDACRAKCSNCGWQKPCN